MKVLQTAWCVAIRRTVTRLIVVLRVMRNGRGGEIRTRDLYVPNVALYQAKLRPDTFAEETFFQGGRSKSDPLWLRKQNITIRPNSFIYLAAGQKKSGTQRCWTGNLNSA